jgi:hypothetical protein
MTKNLEERTEDEDFEEDRYYSPNFAPRRFEPRYVREDLLGRYLTSLAKQFSAEGYNSGSMIGAISRFERGLAKNPLNSKHLSRYLEFLKERGFNYSPE